MHALQSFSTYCYTEFVQPLRRKGLSEHVCNVLICRHQVHFWDAFKMPLSGSMPMNSQVFRH
jgi:hypothetical protein